MQIREGLIVVLVVAGVVFAGLLLRDLTRKRALTRENAPGPVAILIGFVTNFFDTLGIGSFATTTAAFKTLRLVPDENIPGTMLIGHGLPVILQALIFVAVVDVDVTVMLSLIAATTLGGWLGAGIVTKLPRRPIQIGMATGLLLAATFMSMTQLGLFPGGGTAIDLPPVKLVVAIALFALFGAVSMIGIGNYAPSLIVLSVFGMSPRAAFPVMAGAAAMVVVVGGVQFMARGRYNVRAALGLTAGGIPGVLIAAFLVKSLPLAVLRWVVVGVVLYSAVMMLRSAAQDKAAKTTVPANFRPLAD